MNPFKYLNLLIRSGTGYSAKSFYLVAAILISLILLAVPVFLLLYDMIHNGALQSDYSWLPTYMGAVSSILVGAGVTKASGDFAEYKYFKPEFKNKGSIKDSIKNECSNNTDDGFKMPFED